MRNIAVIDDDAAFLQNIQTNYISHGFSIRTFFYPDDLDGFYKASQKFDILLIGHRLGGTNGANVFRNLISRGTKATVIIMSGSFDERYQNFEYYVSKDDILNDPFSILGKKSDIVEQAVESSVLLQKQAG